MAIDEESALTSQHPAVPFRKTVLFVLSAIAVLFGLSVSIDGLAPPFSRAVVQAYVARIAPKVGGRVVEVAVIDNDHVEAGRVLFRIDPRPYQISAIEAQAEVERIGQALGLSTASLEVAQAKLVKASENLETIKSHSERTLELVQHGILAKSRGDAASAALAAARGKITEAEVELTGAWANLGPRGAGNQQLGAAMAIFERAILDLLRTTVTTPTGGLVSDLQLAKGQFASAHQTALTLIDPNPMWILAQFSDDGLRHMAISDQAEVAFDASPNSVFAAEVKSIGASTTRNTVDSNVRLPISESGRPTETRLTDVRLIFADKRPPVMRFGSNANVVVYTGRRPVANAIGHAWIRIISVLNYVR